ncbi:hypothetical protein [Methylobacterium oxalidis]|uniref:Uncharacterized protein n=1 Tax=Methylobacterium oxalidis TaxID=944322 RepID=A0A512J390_9HYPH|nr:hypothetical protein [Methylobacterium oxalidis]GEP04447.1 hypothetical protein MOX02_24850 [Methylobacterium oxalidis]GLS62819.1 hypothetical protein GCM10007888_12000 [Methylobacterium oxalidis]
MKAEMKNYRHFIGKWPRPQIELEQYCLAKRVLRYIYRDPDYKCDKKYDHKIFFIARLVVNYMDYYKGLTPITRWPTVMGNGSVGYFDYVSIHFLTFSLNNIPEGGGDTDEEMRALLLRIGELHSELYHNGQRWAEYRREAY